MKKHGTPREKEALAIKWACEIFRPYLIGSQFIVESDHHSLQWLKNAKSSRLLRWYLALSEYDFTIRYKPGSKNVVADALSRNTFDINSIEQECRLEQVLNSFYQVAQFPFDKVELEHLQKYDPDWQPIIENCLINKGTTTCGNFRMEQNLLFKHNKDGKLLLVIPFKFIEPVIYT